MDKKPIIIMMMVFLSFLVSAGLQDDLVYYYDLDSGSNVLDSTGTHNATKNGGMTFDSDSGYSDGAYDFDNSDDYLNNSHKIVFDANVTSFTVSVWVNATSQADHNTIMGYSKSGGEILYLRIDTSTGYPKVQYRDGNGNNAFSTVPAVDIVDGDYHHLLWTYNGSSGLSELYVDSSRYSGTKSGYPSGDVVARDKYIGAINNIGGSPNNHFNGYIDELGYWDRVLSDTEKTDLFNGAVYPFTATTFTFSTTLTTPTNKDHFNNLTIPIFNWTASTSTNQTNYTIEILNNITSVVTFNKTVIGINNTNITVPDSNISQNNWSKWRVCGYTNAKRNCTDYNEFYLDSINPTMTFNTPTHLNTTVVSSSLDLDVVVSDAYLYKSNLTIYYPNGTQLYNNYTGDITGTLVYNFTESLSASGWETGTYTLFVETVDLHTSKKIPSFDPKKDDKDKKLSFSPYGESFDLELYSVDKALDLQDYYSVKKKDRYSMEYKFKDKSSSKEQYTYKFRVTSSQPLKLIELPDHNAWLVTESDKMIREGGIWFDADLIGVHDAQYVIYQVNKHIWEIQIDTSSKDIKFNSLGGLNYANKTATFQVNPSSNITASYVNNVNETKLTTYNLTVSWKGYDVSAVDGYFRYKNGPENTAIQTSFDGVNNVSKFQINISPELVFFNATTIYHNWSYELFLANGTRILISTPLQNQTVLWHYWVKEINAINMYELESQDINLTLSASPSVGVTLVERLRLNVSYENGTYTLPHTFTPNPVTGTSLVVNSTAYINITFNGTTFIRWSPIHVFTVSRLGLGNCSPGNLVLLNFTIFNELSPYNRLKGTFNALFTYHTGNPALLINYTHSDHNSSSYLICVDSLSNNITTNAYIKYNISGGFTHKYYLTNVTLGNFTTNLSLYNLVNSSSISDLRMTMRNKTDFLQLSETIAHLTRWYPEENIWRTVQMDKSGDYGLIAFNIFEKVVDYRIVFVDKKGRVVKVTDTLKFACDNYVCDRVVLITDYETIQLTPNLHFNHNVDLVRSGATDTLDLTYVDVSGVVSTVRMVVSERGFNKDTIICNITTVGVSGSMSCNLSAHQGTMILQVYKTASPETKDWMITFVKDAFNLATKFQSKTATGKYEMAFWSAGLSMVFISAGAMLGGGIGIIIMTLMSALTSYFLGLWTITNAMILTVLAVMGIVIAILIRR